MCQLCLQDRCHDRNPVCGCKRHEKRLVEAWNVHYDKNGKPIYGGKVPEVLRKKVKISCEYCGQSTNRKKPNRPVEARG